MKSLPLPLSASLECPPTALVAATIGLLPPRARAPPRLGVGTPSHRDRPPPPPFHLPWHPAHLSLCRGIVVLPQYPLPPPGPRGASPLRACVVLAGGGRQNHGGVVGVALCGAGVMAMVRVVMEMVMREVTRMINAAVRE